MSFKAIHNSAFGFYAKREFRPYLKAEAFNNSEWGKHRTPAIDKLIDFSIIMSNNATLVSAKLVDWCKGYAGEETSLSLSLFDINTLNSSNKQVTLNYSGTTLLDSTVYELVLEDSDSNIVYSDFFAAYEVGSTDLPVNAPLAEPSTISGGCIAGEELINSANDLAPNFAANRYIKITDTSEQLQRIDITGLTDSPTFTIFFRVGATVRHGETTNANLYGVYLSTEQDHEFTRPSVIHFQLDRSDGVIREIGRATVVDEIADNYVYAIPVSFPSYNVATTAQIYGFEEDELDGLTIPSLAGEANLSKGAGDWLELGSGNAYNIDIKNTLGETVFYLCLCENNASVTEVHCSVTGRRFHLIGTKTLTTQDVESKIHTNGFQFVDLEWYSPVEQVIVARQDNADFIY